MKMSERKLVPAGLAMMAALCVAASAASVKRIPASEGIEEVSVESDLFEDGLKAASITLSYAKKILPESVTPDDYRIDEGRVIKDVQVKGKDVTLVLDCTNKLLAEPDWNSLEDLPYETQLTVTQTGEVSSSNAKTIFTGSYSVITPKLSWPDIVKSFGEKSDIDNSSGLRLRYSIYQPDGYFDGWNYPLVVFIPDEHVNCDAPKAALLQGQGATVWATKQEQSKHKCIVVSVQYTLANEQEYGPFVSEDGSMTKGLLAVRLLIERICKSYRVDGNRIYGVGQGQGANALMTLSENNPDLFAASILVAPQKQVSDPARLAGQKMWLQVCEGDSAAYSRANLLTDAWENAGAKVAYGKWSPALDGRQAEAEAAKIVAQKAPINCGVFDGGNHPYTWSRIYGIEGIRDWLFRQHK